MKTYIDNARIQHWHTLGIIHTKAELKAIVAERMIDPPCIATLLRWGLIACIQAKEGNRIRNYYFFIEATQ